MVQTIFHLVRTEGPLSRAEIARRLGVSKPTISKGILNLMENDLVVEIGLAQSEGGRRPTLVDYNAKAGYVIGMDIGGTTARAALADFRGKVLASIREPTCQASEAEFLAQLVYLRDQLLQKTSIEASKIITMAIGTPGVIDPSSRVVRYAPNLRLLEAPGFTKRLERKFVTPVSLHNDVNLAALGEQWWGAGHDVKDYVFISIGTGLGFGLVINDQLYQGTEGRAGEFGYTPYPPETGTTLEQILSGKGISQNHCARGGSGNVLDAFSEARAGLEPGASVIGEFIETTAWLICALTTLLDPQRIILGGAIGLALAPFCDNLRRAVAEFSPFVPEILTSQLGDDAGLMGAVATAIQEGEPLLLAPKGGDKLGVDSKLFSLSSGMR